MARANVASTPLCFAITETSNPQMLTIFGYSFLTHSLPLLLALALYAVDLAPLHSFSCSVLLFLLFVVVLTISAMDPSKIGVTGVEANVVGGVVHG